MDQSGSETIDAMTADIVPGETVIVGSTLAFAARAVAELHGIPMAAVHLQPGIFRSKSKLPLLARWSWYVLDTLLLAPTVGAALNRRRTALGLPRVDRPFHRWIHEADALVGLFPEWFAGDRSGWPSHVRLTGFPLYDGDSGALPAEVEAFLSEGEAPIAFTAGTATAASHEFFAVSAEACRQSGKRGILLTHVSQQIPATMPPGVVHFAYAPFSALLPRVSAFVHHGGIGTTSQALRAGVPQLIRPMAHDQFDNANRAVRLGVAEKILPRQYQVKNVVSALGRVTGDGPMRERCAKIAERFDDESVPRACRHILDVLGQRLDRRKVQA